ncbi:MAG: hypothetical protein GX021_09795 [Tissierellia bacterium]|nr:hypothetical protein [Tissierellia bacterium]
MKHYDLVEWKLFKENLLQDQIYKEMEEHLISCDQCMEAFLALIDDKEIEMAEAIVPEDFTKNVMKNIENIRPIKKNQRKKKTYNDFFIYYAAVASVAIILTASGFFGKMVDSIPQVATSINMEESKLKASTFYDFSKKITERTNRFVKNFNLNRIKED